MGSPAPEPPVSIEYAVFNGSLGIEGPGATVKFVDAKRATLSSFVSVVGPGRILLVYVTVRRSVFLTTGIRIQREIEYAHTAATKVSFGESFRVDVGEVPGNFLNGSPLDWMFFKHCLDEV
jgi:hypothetical protein